MEDFLVAPGSDSCCSLWRSCSIRRSSYSCTSTVNDFNISNGRSYLLLIVWRSATTLKSQTSEVNNIECSSRLACTNLYGLLSESCVVAGSQIHFKVTFSRLHAGYKSGFIRRTAALLQFRFTAHAIAPHLSTFTGPLLRDHRQRSTSTIISWCEYLRTYCCPTSHRGIYLSPCSRV